MAAEWRQYVPRKLRIVGAGDKREYLISIPATIGDDYDKDQLFNVNVVDRSIVLTPISKDIEDGRVV